MHPATAPEPLKLPTRNMRYKKHEDKNKRAYGQRVRDIEQGVFTPSSTSSINHRWTGARGRHLLQKTSRHARLEIRKKLYSVVISWLRCKLSFAAVRSSIMCIRGTRSSNHGPLYTEQDHQNNHGPLRNKIIKSWTPT